MRLNLLIIKYSIEWEGRIAFVFISRKAAENTKEII